MMIVFRILSPSVKKICAHFSACLIFLHLIFLPSCSKPEKTLEELFLENVMIRDNGLYVLMGSKPMCYFDIEDGFSEPQERRLYEWHLREIQSNNPTEPPMSYEEFKKQHTLPLRLHFRKLWNRWKETMDSSVSPCYKFVQRKSPFVHEIDCGFFVNVPAMIHLLKTHYEAFSQITEVSFDPLHIVEEMSDNDSVFWERALQSHYLMGLLYGFGERNSFFFDWGAKHGSFPHSQRVPGQELLDDFVPFSYSDLKLPLFGVYSINDPVIENYKREREHIQKQLKGKDFMKTVLEWLSGEPPLKE